MHRIAIASIVLSLLVGLSPAQSFAQPEATTTGSSPDVPDAPAPTTTPGTEDWTELLDDSAVIIIDGEAPLPTTATARTIDAETIALTSRRSADDLLRLIPGLHTSAHGAEGKGQQFFLRGFDAVHGSDLEIRVAGVPVNELSNVHGQGYVDIGFVIPEIVARIDGNKGSFQLDQGNFATAGSVRFELGVPASLRGNRVSYEAGSTNRHRLLAVIAPEDRHESTFAAVEALRDAGYGINRGTERVSALGQARYPLGGERWLRVFASGYASRFGEPGPVPVADLERQAVDFYDSYADDTDGRSSRLLSAVTLHDHGDTWRLDSTAHLQWRQLDLDENFTGFLLYPDMGDRRRQAHESLSGGVQVTFERDLTRRWSLVTGAEGLVDRMEQSEDQITETGMVWQQNRALDAVQAAGNARLGLRAALSDDVTVQAGARLDTFYFTGESRLDGMASDDLMAAVSPRINASWRVSDGLSLFAAYGRGFRSPEARAAIAGPAAGSDAMNENPSPVLDGGSGFDLYDGGSAAISRSDAGEIGARWRPADNLEIGGGVFATYLQNEMLFDHVSGVNTQLDSTRRVGAEIDVQYRPATWLQLRGDVTAVDARFVHSGNPVPAAPRLLATAEARLIPRGPLRAGAQFRYIAPRPLAHGATAESIAVLDVSAEYRFQRWQLGVQVDNALGTRWREGEFHFASWLDRDRPRSQLPQVHYTAGRPLGVRATLTSWF